MKKKSLLNNAIINYVYEYEYNIYEYKYNLNIHKINHLFSFSLFSCTFNVVPKSNRNDIIRC